MESNAISLSSFVVARPSRPYSRVETLNLRLRMSHSPYAATAHRSLECIMSGRMLRERQRRRWSGQHLDFFALIWMSWRPIWPLRRVLLTTLPRKTRC